MNSLILGSKEYPLGTNNKEDTSPSGGMELYVEELINNLKRHSDITVITRKFRGTKSHEMADNVDIWRVSWLKGVLLRAPSFNISSFFKSLKLDYDIMITNGELANLFGLVASKLKRKPIIMVHHGLGTGPGREYRVLLLLLSLWR